VNLRTRPGYTATRRNHHRYCKYNAIRSEEAQGERTQRQQSVFASQVGKGSQRQQESEWNGGEADNCRKVLRRRQQYSCDEQDLNGSRAAARDA
jgi:hypothetical protein